MSNELNELFARIDEIKSKIYIHNDDATHKILQRMVVLLGDCKAALSQQEAEAWKPSGLEYDRAIHCNPDACAWADFFISTFPNCGADRELMIGWFANAMMAMYDHEKNKTKQEAEPVEEWMPIIGTCLSIPMRILNESQAKANHSQSLERLKERGGISLGEAVAIAERRKYTSLEAKKSLAILTQLATGAG